MKLRWNKAAPGDKSGAIHTYVLGIALLVWREHGFWQTWVSPPANGRGRSVGVHETRRAAKRAVLEAAHGILDTHADGVWRALDQIHRGCGR